MPLRIRDITLTTQDQTITPSKNLTIIVGPNNVGKSVLLSQVFARMSFAPDQPATIPTVPVADVGVDLPSVEEVEARLSGTSPLRPPGSYPQGTFYEPHYLMRNGGVMTVPRMHTILAAGNSYLGELLTITGILLSPEARLGQLTNQAPPDMLGNPHVQSPLQVMWSDRKLEDRISDLAQRAFGIPITVNRHAGSQISLHAGRPAAPEPRIGDTTDYQSELMGIPLVATQGHGVQAYLGILPTLASQQFDLILIDEPEAFLHPPQARLLGEVFVEFSRGGSQVVVSTHSDDFLQGVISASATSADVSVVRLTRPTVTTNAVAQVEPDAIRHLYEDPLLRFSKILSGIFYKGVVLCESESDCQYYEAVLDHQVAQQAPAPARPDLLFAQCGGKDRFAKAVGALRATKVPIAVLADIDLLADANKFNEVVTALGGDYSTVESDVNVISSAARAADVEPDRVTAKVKIDTVLNQTTHGNLTAAQVKAIRDAVARSSGWKLIKRQGRGALPSGDATKAFDAVLAYARTVGLFLVPVGELERFHPEIPSSNKQAWLRRVFESGVYKTSAEASKFVGSVAAFIAAAQQAP